MRSRVICIGSQTKRSVPEPTVADREGLGAGGGVKVEGGAARARFDVSRRGLERRGMGGEGFFQGCAPVHVCAFVYTRVCVCVHT